METMNEEKTTLKKNVPWDLVLIERCKIISCKWVFKKKLGLGGSVEK